MMYVQNYKYALFATIKLAHIIIYLWSIHTDVVDGIYKGSHSLLVNYAWLDIIMVMLIIMDDLF